MLRFLVRALGVLLIAAGFVGFVVDATRSIANGAVAFTPFGEIAYGLFRDRYLLLQPGIERNLHPSVWQYVVLPVTLAPAGLVAFLVGLLLLWLGRRPQEPIGHLAGP
jgi:hypothetical protein